MTDTQKHRLAYVADYLESVTSSVDMYVLLASLRNIAIELRETIGMSMEEQGEQA